MPNNLVTVSAFNETGWVGFYVPQKEGHLPTGMKGSVKYFASANAEKVEDGATGRTKHGGDLGAPYGVSPGVCEDGTEGYSVHGSIGLQVLDPVEESEDVTCMGVDRVAVPNGF